MVRRTRQHRSATSWRDAAHRNRTRREGPTVGTVALTAVRGYGRWVARSPDTRGLANALAVLYPLGEIGHQAGADPLMLGAFAPPAALAAWVGTHKKHASPRYSATVAATAAGIPAWLATAAQLGIVNLHTLLAYTVSASVTWSAYTWSDVLKQRRAWAREQLRWDELATAAGLEGSRLVGMDDTRLGVRFRVDVRATNKRASQLAGNGRGLAEDIAAQIGLPAERVRITTDDKHAGIIRVLVQMTDPWAGPVLHPAMPAHPDRATVPASREEIAAAGRSIKGMPLVVGAEPDSGDDMSVTLFDHEGGHHAFIVAPTGSGKTTFYNNLIEQATVCADVLVWGIDLGKGTIARFWGPTLDAAAGIGEQDEALERLRWACTVIDERSDASGGKNHTPSPTEPVILVFADELDTLTGMHSPIAYEAKPLVEHIWRRGRSAGVILLTASQRGVQQYTGSKDPNANADYRIVLRMKRASEMGNAIEDWEAAGMPNMATYARGVKGVALVVDGENTWTAGRVRDLSDLDTVKDLAKRRGAPVATLEPAIAAKLPGYADRRRTPAHTGGRSDGGSGGHTPGHDDPGPTAARPATSGDGFGVDPGDHDAVDRLAGELVAEVEARLRDMPEPPKQGIPLADLVKANQSIKVPDDAARTILALLTERGPDGARRDELVTALDKPESTVKKWLAAMRSHDLITRHGSTKAARYYLPDHHPDNHAQ
ncbi:type IV secretory system conjugative DNA transfer family protein [Actinomadura sp. NPDC048955]|uniref:type IV secretory system conjugative DNA transfer family protein n=1 Tax=Actinomadura sp. NPDC048955 TaxID=3158228 RepID=UPI0033DF7C23